MDRVDEIAPPPNYDAVQPAGKKSKKPKKAPAAAASAAREVDQRNVRHVVSSVTLLHCLSECTFDYTAEILAFSM